MKLKKSKYNGYLLDCADDIPNGSTFIYNLEPNKTFIKTNFNIIFQQTIFGSYKSIILNNEITIFTNPKVYYKNDIYYLIESFEQL